MFVFLSLLLLVLCQSLAQCNQDQVFKEPAIFVAIFARNKEITLPYFLRHLQEQDYPKQRISLWIKSDHNVDRTIEILNAWLSKYGHLYHSFNFFTDESETQFTDEEGPAHWSSRRFNHIINLREEALNIARSKWADFIFFIDCDIFLLNNQTFRYLVRQNSTVTAPMLKSLGLYSNYWCGMTDTYYYLRTDDYKPILNYEKQGCFNVPMIHSAIAVNLNHVKSDNLTFNSSKITDYDGPIDDIITFAVSAKRSGVNLSICNENDFGYVMLPLTNQEPLNYDKLTLINLKVDILVNNPPLRASSMFLPYLPKVTLDKMGFDEIYMINLKRRPERRIRMLESFHVLGLNVSIFDAIDGRSLTNEYIRKLGIEFMPEYKDPYHKRDMTHGEIGCFLSHYFIWKKVVENDQKVVMVLEDDVKFEPYFRQRVAALLKEANDLKLSWDLIYLGRKRLVEEEDWVKGSESLVNVAYSYWTCGYLLTNQGARKLLEQNPLKNLIPVDEYLPIMFDKHPEKKWKSHFAKRNLNAYSVAPLLIYPTHYTGEKNYVSDTENSAIIQKSEQVPEAWEEL